ncbi:HAD family hydrolase [Lentilactobacillus sunkii]|uniref:Haloacid dehalogenase domain-containing protein hydrolase n=1 Tax=Lentilactobacillus sunkii DSM 19904 TaxID=1423808 RepID=A0A0R1L037_9LACO|nr:HAD family hydrolase [Lentilactobacillus sunkii]KRK89116.1 haloacid dehalogenase domain-containing protein hydrolase [Lentilactobacillus sunkii DSM 19904]
MIKAIVFDVDDTLYDTQPSFTQAFDEIFNLNIDDKLMNQIYSNFTQQAQLAIVESNSDSDLELSKAEIDFHSLHHTFKKFELPGLTQESAGAFTDAFQAASNSIHLFDGLTTVFNTLTTKFKLGIITNGSNDVQLAKIMKLKLHHWFGREQIITSEDAQAKKPDPLIFTLMNRKFNLRGNEMMYVGSSYYEDIVPAKKAGWETVWYNSHQSPIANPQIIPDQTVTTPEELKDLLMDLAAQIN